MKLDIFVKYAVTGGGEGSDGRKEQEEEEEEEGSQVIVHRSEIIELPLE